MINWDFETRRLWSDDDGWAFVRREKSLPPALPEVPAPTSHPLLQIFATFTLYLPRASNWHIFPPNRRIDLQSSALYSLTSCDCFLTICNSFAACATSPAPPAQEHVPRCYFHRHSHATARRPLCGHNDPICNRSLLISLDHCQNLDQNHPRHPTSSHRVAPCRLC